MPPGSGSPGAISQILLTCVARDLDDDQVLGNLLLLCLGDQAEHAQFASVQWLSLAGFLAV